MPFEMLDRSRLKTRPLAERVNRRNIEREAIYPGRQPPELRDEVREVVALTAGRIRRARRAGRSVMLAFGAHTIKNCLGPVLIHMMERGWLTHLATNGAGIIHDWEFAFTGESSEHVAANLEAGQFGLWEETNHYLNLALLVGAWRGLGYGESVGAMIAEEALEIPERALLLSELTAAVGQKPFPESAAGACDLLWAMDRLDLGSGRVEIPHPCKRFSVQAAAHRLGVPFTAHPMIGHDIIYTHPLNHGGAIGRAALRDFLVYAQGVSRLGGGVYMSIGSAVMSPMIFEKSMSMAQNLAIQAGSHIDDHYMVVVDVQQSTWDWTEGEPPEGHPDYYLRCYKTFHRMGGELRYACADNRDFLPALCRELED
ncbi:MAG: hypothetical protein QGH74_01025 [Candidatus Brocadiia bacterium]|jgi:hypothetical protein|nr:hypothetical protein [Candidatus Brocadiia bacterium]